MLHYDQYVCFNFCIYITLLYHSNAPLSYCYKAVPWFRSLVAGLSLQEDRVHTHVNPYGICGGQSGTGTGFSEFFGFFPVNITFHRRSQNSYHLGNA
jgi:hypothetical protein